MRHDTHALGALSAVLAALLATVVAGCDSPRDCEPGATMSCACDGGTGVSTCTAEGRVGACVCDGEMDGGPRDAGRDAMTIDAPIDEDSGTDAGDDSGPADSGSDSGPSICDPECEMDQICCASTCIYPFVDQNADGRTDPSFDNCGGCGVACDSDRANACADRAGTPGCVCGGADPCATGSFCLYQAAMGTFSCVAIDIQNDPDNCGAVGNECADGEVCRMGRCECDPACGAGLTCCAGQCIDLMNDVDNCGACGGACGPTADGCMAGSCRCGATAECAGVNPKSLGSLCCSGTCSAQSEANCGTCGTSCGGSQTCRAALSLTLDRAIGCCAEPDLMDPLYCEL